MRRTKVPQQDGPMKIKSQILLIVISLAVLVSCGGGGSTTSTPPPAVQNADPGGIWRGTFTSDVVNETADALGVVTENGEIRFLSFGEGAQFFGQLNVTGNSFSGTLNAVSLAGFQFINGSSSGTVSVSGTISSRVQISGSYSGVGDSGTFAFTYDPLYERQSSLSRISGNWSAGGDLLFKAGTVGNVDGAIGVVIESNGVLSAGDTDFCDYDGLANVLDSSFNVYDVQVNISACGSLNGQYQGFGVLSDSVSTDDTLTVAISNSVISIPGELSRASQASASGIWNGFLVSPISGVLQVLGLISEDNEMRFINQAGTQLSGTADVNGNFLMTDMLAFAPLGQVFPDGTSGGLVNVRGVVSDQIALDGTFFGVGDVGTFDLTYDPIYERDSSLDRIQGSWSLTDATGLTLVINIDASGGLLGTNSIGCGYAGDVSLIDSNVNAYRAALDVTFCGAFNGAYTGLATLIDSAALNDTLVFGVSNANVSVTGYFLKQPELSTGNIDPTVFPAGANVSMAYPNVILSTAQVSAEINDLDVVTPLRLISNNTGPVLTNGNVFLTDTGSASWSADVRLGDDALRIDFQLPTTSISATIIPDDTDTAVMQIYDAQSQLLGEAIARMNVPFTLSLDAPGNTNIAFALVAPIDGASIGLIQATVVGP